MNIATPSLAPSAEEIRESESAFQSLMVVCVCGGGGGATLINIRVGGATLINISVSNGDLICYRMIIPAAP